MQIGDIWLDKFGDYLLVTDVSKVNVRSKTKPFYICIGAILMTNNLEDKDVVAGMYVDDYVPEYIVEKIA